MLGQVGDAQDRGAAEQSVGHERRPGIAVRRQARQCAGVGGGGDGARFLGGSGPGRIGDLAQWRRNARRIAGVAMIAVCHGADDTAT